MIDEERIHKTHAVLAEARRKLAIAVERDIAAKQTLERARITALTSGQIVGKNETERDACARTLLASEYEAVAKQELDTRFYRVLLDEAALDWEALKLELRWQEVIARTTAPEEI